MIRLSQYLNQQKRDNPSLSQIGQEQVMCQAICRNDSDRDNLDSSTNCTHALCQPCQEVLADCDVCMLKGITIGRCLQYAPHDTAPEKYARPSRISCLSILHTHLVPSACIEQYLTQIGRA